MKTMNVVLVWIEEYLVTKLRNLEPLGITYPQYLVFLALWEQDEISLKSLGARLYLDSGTLTPLLKRLEKQGFVKRQRAAEDEREIRIVLTEKGKKLRSQARGIPGSLLCELGVEPEDVGKIRNDMKRLLTIIADGRKPL